MLPKAAQAVMVAKEAKSVGCFKKGEDWTEKLKSLLDHVQVKSSL